MTRSGSSSELTLAKRRKRVHVSRRGLAAAAVLLTAVASWTATPAPAASIAAMSSASLTLAMTVTSTDIDYRPGAGDPIDYSFLVTNDGDATLTNVAVVDPLPGLGAVTCPSTTLAPGASTTCTSSSAYVVSQADVDNGGPIVNTATATGVDPAGPTTVESPPSSTTTPVVAGFAWLQILKTKSLADTNGDNLANAGEQITYSFRVSNDGNVTITGTAVVDPLPGLGPVTCPATTLAPRDEMTCTAAPYVVSQADVDSGIIRNTATVEGIAPRNLPILTEPSSQSIQASGPGPDLTLVKSAALADTNSDGLADVAERIDYSFLVTNTGGYTLTGVAVDDYMPGLGVVACPATAVGPGASTTCSASYVVTLTDVDADRPITNTATATAIDPFHNPRQSPLSSTTTPIATPELTMVMSAVLADANGDGLADVGDQIDYSLVATNTGNAVLTDVDIFASLAPATCPATTLGPSGSTTCTASYVVTQTDVDARQPISNFAVATGNPPDGRHAVYSGSSITTTPVAAPALALAKSALLADSNADGLADIGEQIDYSFAVTNTGNAILTDIGIFDPLPGLGPVTCPATTLGRGGSTTCTASYGVTQTDVDAGVPIVNSATAAGTPPDGQPAAYSPPSSTTTPVVAPALALAKSAALADTNTNQTADAGEVIDYSFSVTNTGNVPLSGVAVVEAMPGLGAVTCPSTTLGPGVTTTCGPVSYVVTEADRRRARTGSGGYIVNTATASGFPPRSAPVESSPYSTFTLVGPAPALFLYQSATLADSDGDGGADAGEQIDYSFGVINIGDFDLSGVAVVDALPGVSPVSCASTSLAPSATTTCTASYLVTQDDVDAGTPIVSSAVATGIPPAGVPGGPAESNTSSASTAIGSPPPPPTTSTTVPPTTTSTTVPPTTTSTTVPPTTTSTTVP
ncbi:MAG: hypothetical protein QOI99_1, partial [Actinomycetota bacterium]|nr:hypothetical protein [Actinomycetota bacterium]